METLLMLLILSSLLALIIGLIKPSLVIRWEDEKKTRGQVLKYYGGVILVLFVLSALIIDDTVSYKVANGELIEIGDENLESAIREAIDKEEGPINLSEVESLSLDRSGINNIEPLKEFTNLRRLNLNHNEIKDISPLKHLTNLRRLSLRGNEVSDIEPLKNLTELRTLDLGYNGWPKKGIKNIEPLRNLNNLADVNLDRNKIEDFSPLKELPDLRRVVINMNPPFIDGDPEALEIARELEKRGIDIGY